MLKLVEKPNRMRPGARTMPSSNDKDLLLRIAGQRDKAAFEEIVARYNQDAFNLALHISGNQALAEEAVQEALLRVWLSARSFRADGNARGWIMRIVSRECLRKRQDRRREAQEMTREGDRRRTLATSPTPPGEAQELLTGLRASLSRLPEQHRQLVALYFGGGLSQREISTELNVPERTVSYRIDEALRWMREHLKETGLAAAVPMLNAEGLGNALCTGPVPGGLSKRILDAARSAVEQSAKHSLRATVGWSAASKLMIALAIVCAAGGGWVIYSALEEEKPAEPTATVKEVKNAPAAPIAKKRVVSSFDDGMPKNLTIEGATAQWVSKRGKSGGGLYFGPDKEAERRYGHGAPCFLFPAEALRPPVKISCDIRIERDALINPYDVFWAKEGERIDHISQIVDMTKVHFQRSVQKPKHYEGTLQRPEVWTRITWYVTATDLATYREITLSMYMGLRRPWTEQADRLGMVMTASRNGCVIDNLVIEEIAPTELPDFESQIEKMESSHD